VNGELYFLGSAGTVNASFLYGTTSGGPYPFSTTPQGMSAPGSFQATLSGLSPNTTYYYLARGDGGQYGTTSGLEQRFTTSAVPPTVATNDAGGVTANAATLNGSLTDLGTATTVNVSFQYGTTAGGPYPYTTTPQAMAAPGAFQTDITSLYADTTYYCRAVADGGTYGICYGEQKSFTTSKIPPSVTTDNATGITAGAAVLNGDLTSLGTAGTVNVSFNWGTTHGGPYPNHTTPQAMSAGGPFRTGISGLAALTTYYFVAAADGGAHGSALGSECSFTTAAVPPSVSTGAVTAVTDNSATLHGTLHALGTSTSDNVSFQWGTRPGVYTHQTALQPFTIPGDFTDVLTGLSGNTTYYYRAVATGARNGTSFGMEHVFTTRADPPSVTTEAATDWTTDTAFLNGDLTDLGTASTVNASFIYGTSAGGPYPFTTDPRARTTTGAFRSGITGLSPFTTYYYKAKADGGLFGTSYGLESHFTTNRLPPVVTTGSAIDVMTNAAILNGKLDLLGSASTVNMMFECGTAPGVYTWETSPQPMTAPGDFQAQLLGLTPNTTYYYRTEGNGGDHGTGYGEELSFTTGAHPPIVATNAATNVMADAAMLRGDLLNTGSAQTVNVRFEYGTTQGGPYFNATAPQSKASAGAFDAAITGLNPRTAYYYRSRADGGIYGSAFGAEKSFVTSGEPPVVTTNSASSITATSATLNGDLTSLGRAETVNISFLYGTTAGGPYTNTIAYPTGAPGTFSTGLSGLSSGTTYYFLAQADGGIFGKAFGIERSFTTSIIPPPNPSNPHSSSGGLASSLPPILPISLPNVVVQSATLSTSYAAPGDPVEIAATVSNVGTVNGNTVIKLYVNGQETAVRSITVESGKSRKILFTTVQSEPGTYTVYVNGVQAGSFMVKEYIDPDIVLFISMALILCSLTMGVVYVWRRRQQQY
jgi:phosphodiesterase/alkaline phosphatase D-like protein